MKSLWAPWRLEFVSRTKRSGCFLCETLKGASSDGRRLLLYTGKTCFCMLNKFPYNNGHLLIAPKRHKGRLEQLTDAESLELLRLTGKMQEVLRKAIKPHGFNMGFNLGQVAGAGLPGHLHLHIVPRWRGDTNFMPVLADVKVMPQSLDALCKCLKSHLKSGVQP
jgi:ATP adenylyltransferase